MRSYFPHLLANDALRTRIGTALENGTLSHAYIIEGPDGSGKRTFAREIAAALACSGRGSPDVPLPCGDCPSCRKILAENATDVRYLSPATATIGVDAVRELRSDMYLSSTENEYKIYIIEDAHTMTPQAQNALLIVLEEPPTNLVIFLLTDRASSLLPTVRSRAQLLRMACLTPEQTEVALADNAVAARMKREKPDAYAALLESAGGRLGAALDLLDAKRAAELMKNRTLTESVIGALLTTRGFADKVPVLQSLPTKRAEITPVLDLTLTALRDLVLLCRDDTAPLCFYTDRTVAGTLAHDAGIQRLTTLFDTVTRAQNALQLNANISLTLLALFTGA